MSLYKSTERELAERDRRPGGRNTVCQKCRYWECEEWDTEQLAKDNAENGGVWSDVVGFCKRRAPIPVAALENDIGQLIGEIALILHGAHNFELTEHRDYHLEGRDTFEIHEWPITNANDWCGEFEARAG